MSQSVIQLKEPEGAFLVDISHFKSGLTSVLNSIPSNMPGIYAWFRSYHYPDNPDTIYELLMNDLFAPKFQTREGAVKPFYEVTIRSKSWFSEPKMKILKDALSDDAFRHGLLEALSTSMLFQSPLYIGKSINIKERIKCHLNIGSILRNRLSEANVEIERTMLLIIPNHDQPIDLNYNFIVEDISEMDESNCGFDKYETLYEEIFSRLFSPQFTVRIG